MHFSSFPPACLSGALSELLPLVSSAPHSWAVSNAFWHPDSSAVSWAQEPHWAWEITGGRNHGEKIFGRTFREIQSVPACKKTSVLKTNRILRERHPPGLVHSQKCPRLLGMERDPLEETSAIATGADRCLARLLKHWRSSPFGDYWGWSGLTAHAYFSLMLGQSNHVRPLLTVFIFCNLHFYSRQI